MPRDHFIPAAVLGEFSADKKGHLRERRIAVQRASGEAFMTKAENVGWTADLYGAANSPDRWVDDTWSVIERKLPSSIRELEGGGPITAETWLRVLVPHVATLFVRGHEFEDRYMQRFRDSWGRQSLRMADPEAGEDSDQRTALDLAQNGANNARIFELQRLLALVTCARWVVCHIAPSQQFLNNDLGLAGTIDLSTDQAGWLVPLSSEVAVGIFPAVQRDVVAWSDGSWWAQLDHVYPPAPMFTGMHEAVAASARQFVIGRDRASVNSVAKRVGAMMDHQPLMEAWGFTSSERRMNEFLWHRLVGFTYLNQQPGTDGPQPVPVLFDLPSSTDSWYPMVFLGVNTTPREDGLVVREGHIWMSLRYAGTDRPIIRLEYCLAPSLLEPPGAFREPPPGLFAAGSYGSLSSPETQGLSRTAGPARACR